MSSTRIACIAIIGKNVCSCHWFILSPHTNILVTQNSPLHLSPFPATSNTLKYHFLTHATLDVFQARLPLKSNGDSDFGLLYSVDEGLAAYGWLTNTGVKIIVVVDVGGGGAGTPAMKDGELKPVCYLFQEKFLV